MALSVPHIDIDPKYNVKHKTHMHMIIKGYSSNENNAFDVYGNLLFTPRRKVISLSNRHVLSRKKKDKSADIGQLRIKRDSLLQETHYVGAMDELKRFKLSLRSCSSSNFHINMLHNFKDKEIIISQIKGNYEHNLCDIEINHVVITSSSPVLKVSSKSMADEGDCEAVIEKVLIAHLAC